MRSNSNGDTLVSKLMAHNQPTVHPQYPLRSVFTQPEYVLQKACILMSSFCLELGLSFLKQLTDSACARRRASNSNQITDFNQDSFSGCKRDNLLSSVSFPNWKWLKQGKLHGKQTQQYFSVVSETTKDTPADNRYAVFPQLSPRLPFLSFLVSCLLWIYKTKMSKGIRITDSSLSTAITDLADYFHARRTLFCFFVCWYWAQCCAHIGGNELQQSMTVITFIDL